MKLSATFTLLAQTLVASIAVVAATPGPLPGSDSVVVRDPAVFFNPDTGKYFAFSTDESVRIFSAPALTGPWTRTGSVLGKACSVIDLPLKCNPWAPDVNRLPDGTFTLYYSVSTLGSQDSAIGLATSPSMEEGTWTDHGAVFSSKPGDPANAIDPNLFFDGDKMWMTYGSYWNGMYRLPMKDMMTLDGDLPGTHTAGANGRPAEGGFLYRPPGSQWIYFLFSDGVTPLGGATSNPAPGEEYKVRVGRAETMDGPFLGPQGVDLTVDNRQSGYLLLGSHDNVYAPGGQSLFWDPTANMTVMGYHYVKASEPIGSPSYLGINYVSFESGWPEVV
ncbi:glycoside hydrolase family 43 protein [Auriculariales sp. MPI-PUGE-AT-0066]|nr:glycoside hydrolase family 43 protein [Auriculariales sp. MPI-PUGE-AT-0066]